MMVSETKTLIEALRILAKDIQSDDGVANACIWEAAQRLEELSKFEMMSALDQDFEVPPFGKDVLVYDADNKIYAIGNTVYDDESGHFYWDVDTDIYGDVFPTHWQYLGFREGVE